MMNNSTFIFREEWLDYLDELEAEARMHVIGAVVEYAFMQEDEREDYNPLSTPAERIAFRFITRTISRDQEVYNTKVENGMKGGRKPKGNRTETESKPKRNRKETEPKPNQNRIETESEPNDNRTETLSIIHSYNPILMSNPILYSSFQKVFDYSSDERKEQQQEVSEYFLFERDMKDAQRESQRYITYNELPGKTSYTQMTEEERRATMTLWKPEKPSPPRFPTNQLKAWKDVYDFLDNLDAPLSVRKAATDDSLDWKIKDGNIILRCPKILYMALELYLDELRNVLQRFRASCNASRMTYTLTDVIAGEGEEVRRTLAELQRLKAETINTQDKQ